MKKIKYKLLEFYYIVVIIGSVIVGCGIFGSLIHVPISLGALLFIAVAFLAAPKLIYIVNGKLIEKRLSKSGIRDIDRMDGYQFEFFVKSLFKELGYHPKVTQKGHDYGVDVVLKGTKKIVIQAKRYGYKNTVGIKAVQEIHAGKTYYNADEAWVLTNSFFTKSANELAKACDVKLIDRLDLQDLIIKVNPKVKPVHVRSSVPKGDK